MALLDLGVIYHGDVEGMTPLDSFGTQPLRTRVCKGVAEGGDLLRQLRAFFAGPCQQIDRGRLRGKPLLARIFAKGEGRIKAIDRAQPRVSLGEIKCDFLLEMSPQRFALVAIAIAQGLPQLGGGAL